MTDRKPDRLTVAPRPTYRSALRTRPFRRLLAGHGIGTVAQLMLTLALGIEVLDRTGSGWSVSVTVALGFVPYVVASGYAGLLADRHSRSAMLTFSFVTRAGCAALLAVGLPMQWPVPLLVAVAAAAAVLATPSYPALAAATVQCVPDEQLPPAKALVTGVENVTWMAGPGVLGGLLLFGAGPSVGTATATALFLFAAALSAGARLPRPVQVAVDKGVWPELRAGLHAVARVAAVRRPMTVAVIDNFLYGYVVVAMAWCCWPPTSSVATGASGCSTRPCRSVGCWRCCR
jgi:MFS family permease